MVSGIRTNINGASRSNTSSHNYNNNMNSAYRSYPNQSKTITLDLSQTRINTSRIVTNVNNSTNRVSTYVKKDYAELLDS